MHHAGKIFEVFGIYSNLALFQLFFTYCYSSIVTFQAISYFLKIDKTEAPKILSYCLGLGPLTIYILLMFLLWLFPYHQDTFYVLTIDAVVLLISIFFPKQFLLLANIFQVYFKQFSAMQSFDPLTSFIKALVFICILFSFIQATIAPLSEGDPLQYAAVARLIYENKTISLYPITSTAGNGGIIASWTHPPLYMVSFVWSYLSQGFSDQAGTSKFISPMFLLYSTLLVGQILSKKSKLASALGMLFLCTTPLYYSQTIAHAIDLMRIYTWLLVFAFLYEFLNHKSWRYPILMGYLLGMCLLSHSSGILALPIVAIIYLVLSREFLLPRILKITVTCAIGCLIVLPSYIVNIHKYGTPIQDSTPVWQVKQMDFDNTTNALRDLATEKQKWLNGVLAGFSQNTYFGISYWILLLAVISLIIKSRNIHGFYTAYGNRNLTDICLYKVWIIPALVILGFYGMCILSVILGKNIFIKNIRYLMTVQPFIAIIDAAFVATLYEQLLQQATMFVRRKFETSNSQRIALP